MPTKEQTFTRIAQQHLLIETLEQRNHDSLDFHEVGVIGVRLALEAAYEAGRRAARAKRADPKATRGPRPVKVNG